MHESKGTSKGALELIVQRRNHDVLRLLPSLALFGLASCAAGQAGTSPAAPPLEKPTPPPVPISTERPLPACGETCTGTCFGERCSVALASGQSDPHAVAVDSTHLYWLTADDTDSGGRIMRVPIGGGPVAELASGQDEPQRLAVKDGFVFWTDRGSGQHDGTVKKVGLGGGAVTTLATQQSYPFDVAVGQGAVYWTDADDGTVMKIAATGGVPVTLATGQKGIGPLRVRDDGVYWLAGGSVLRASLDGRTISTLFRRARPRFEGSLRLDLQADLAVDETSVYWVDGAEIISVSRGAGPAHWLVAERQPEEIRGLAVLAGDLYWGSPMIVARDSPATSQFKIAEAHGFALMKRSLAGGSSEALAYFSGGPYSHEVDRIAVDATSIYWADEKSGIVGKLTPR